MPTEGKPWLDYAGQSTEEILACRETHRIDSLLCALEEAIYLRQSRHGKKGTTTEERILLAMMALDREVNNGGYDQFFLNSSKQYVPTIVRNLERIGCGKTAALTARAIALRSPKQDSEAFDALDEEYYQLGEIEPRLWEFVSAHPKKFVLEKTTVPPRPVKRGNRNISALQVYLESTPKTEHSFEAVRLIAIELAAQLKLSPSDAELDAAVHGYLFQWFLRNGLLEEVEPYAWLAFEHTRVDTGQCVDHRKWAEQLVDAGSTALADEATLRYLEYLKGDDISQPFISNRVKFWQEFILKHPEALPRSVAFFGDAFPEFA